MFDKFMRFLANPSSKEIETKEVGVMTSYDRVANKPTKGYPEAVVKIHGEFNTAGDILFEQCMKLINSSDKGILEKAKRLRKLGFKQVEQIKESEKIAITTEIVELVSYYREHYPFNKFITPEQVNTICRKYNLIMGDVSRFKGFVPERNLREIENFKLRKEEKNCLCCRSSEGTFFTLTNAIIAGDSNGKYEHIYKIGDKNNYAFQRGVGEVPFYASDSSNIFGMAHLGFISSFEVESSRLQICAPLKDMDVEGMRISKDLRIEHIPDPVVLQAVKGGYLIVTAWGDEASDELVVNEINN